jgi:hypothetical protein
MAEQPTQGSFRETHDSIEFGAAEATPPAPEQSGARVVYERQDALRRCRRLRGRRRSDDE